MEMFLDILYFLVGGVFGFLICRYELKRVCRLYTAMPSDKEFNEWIADREGDGPGGDRDANIAQINRIRSLVVYKLKQYSRESRQEYISRPRKDPTGE